MRKKPNRTEKAPRIDLHKFRYYFSLWADELSLRHIFLIHGISLRQKQQTNNRKKICKRNENQHEKSIN